MPFETSTILIWIAIYISVFVFFMYDIIRCNFLNHHANKLPSLGEFSLTMIIAGVASSIITAILTEAAKQMQVESLIYLGYIFGAILLTFGMTVLIYLTVKFMQMSGVEKND